MIPIKTEAEKYQDAQMDLRVWIQHRDSYMYHNNDGELKVATDLHCFIVEKADIGAFNGGGPHFVVMVKYTHL